MLTSVTCAKCQKHYKVDSKLGGRTVKCKHCGQGIPIPKSEGAPAEAVDDLMAGLAAAAEAERAAHSSVAPPPASATSGKTGRKPAPAVRAAAAAPRGRTLPVRVVDEEEYDHGGQRRSREHSNGVLKALDTITVVTGQVIFWAYVVLLLLVIIVMMKLLSNANSLRRDHGVSLLPFYVWFACIFGPLLMLALYAFVKIPLCTMAANLAGKILKFQLPEEPRWRLISVDVLAAVIPVLGIVIMAIVAAIESGLSGMSPAAWLAPVVCFTLPLCIPLHFLLTWLVLRLEFLEALTAWIYMMVASVVYMMIVFGIGKFIDFLAS